jgi:hypothetical protein
LNQSIHSNDSTICINIDPYEYISVMRVFIHLLRLLDDGLDQPKMWQIQNKIKRKHTVQICYIYKHLLCWLQTQNIMTSKPCKYCIGWYSGTSHVDMLSAELIEKYEI